jgi:anti-sigma regulatory factor (Ser/Thr protein kinase)
LTGLGLDPTAVSDVVLACGEACTNAAEHAYSGGGTGDLSVEARVVEDQLEIIVRDFGHWRRPATAGRRGRGVGLMRQLMDEVIVTVKDVGTSVVMRTTVSR